MMVNLVQPSDVGVHALPLSLFLPSRAKLWCTLQLRVHADTLPLLLLYPITESYVGLLILLVDLAFVQIHTHMTIYTNVKNSMYTRSA